ncbi:hypothetical protein BDZ97DRAFT_48231 [Flammula alnicola]|nr:hypothetical protein BDZ97DRAFT_48231 [Flammula alnicola]
MASRFSFFFLLSLLVNTLLLIHAQNISTTTPVPPLQWINLSNLLQGSTRPPPLRDAALGYDENSRSLIIFGGISEGGFPQSQTFLLNLQTLSWSTPSPPATLKGTPPARSAVVSGSDFAASNRHGFIVIGGKGSDGKALSDVWEYDFINQFWSQVALSSGGPSARWGASGGIDIRVPPVSDPILPGPNNTFYLTGGFDGSTADSLSDVWSLKLSGTLSSNLPNSVSGSWDHVNIGNMPGRVDQAGTVVLQQIVATGGCDANISPTTSNTTCAKQDSFIINVQSQTNASPGSCPAPRVFVMLGTFNASLWQDSDGLARGEVAILDINTGIWTRTIPSGDPGSSVQFPSPREGATAISFSQALVGDSRNNSADTIIFGGQDLNGTFLSDVWLLRAYSGIVTASSPGFGNGQLQTGINADGSGVRVDFLTECASFVSQPSPTHVSSPSSTTTSPPSSGSISPTPQAPHSFDTSFSHKLLLPLSLVISLPVFLFFRWTQMTLEEGWIPNRHIVLLSLATIVGIAAYASVLPDLCSLLRRSPLRAQNETSTLKLLME